LRRARDGELTRVGGVYLHCGRDYATEPIEELVVAGSLADPDRPPRRCDWCSPTPGGSGSVRVPDDGQLAVSLGRLAWGRGAVTVATGSRAGATR